MPPILPGTIQPDPIDFRDRMYMPTLDPLEPAFNETPFSDAAQAGRVKDQGATNACTGFALSAMVEALLDRAGRLGGIQPKPKLGRVSPFMLYHFARIYDEIPGDAAGDAGSTARGTMKAWHKHGACATNLWPKMGFPGGVAWIGEAFTRPLGAYYRVAHDSLADMHAAINETGVLYATASVHEGWMTPKQGAIPFRKTAQPLGGHAFLIVGYDAEGFWVQNSWGDTWGRKGFAHLRYGDWNENGWDCWVAQAGVQTSSYAHGLGAGLSLGNLGKATVALGAEAVRDEMLSSSAIVSARQINPYVINLENNGTLSASGEFTTTEHDLHLLVSEYIPNAIKDFGLGDKEPLDVAIYAHGGLTPEKGAADTARTWVPALYANKIFPLFIMWETGLADTIGNLIKDRLGLDQPAGFLKGPLEKMSNFLDDRLESLTSKPGRVVWSEMKANAEHASANKHGGLRKLRDVFAAKAAEGLVTRLRFHLIGHSAGAIFHAHLLEFLLKDELRVDGLYMLAPAARLDLFETKVFPRLGGKKGQVPSYVQFHLTDRAERDDHCMHAYRKSLLYLVSNAFEDKRGRELVGMEKFFKSVPKPGGMQVWEAIATPTGSAKKGFASDSSSHGGFGTEPMTVDSILHRLAQRRALRP